MFYYVHHGSQWMHLFFPSVVTWQILGNGDNDDDDGGNGSLNSHKSLFKHEALEKLSFQLSFSSIFPHTDLFASLLWTVAKAGGKLEHRPKKCTTSFVKSCGCADLRSNSATI